MARAMYEYTKTILKKVSFNSDLFCKELEKLLKRLLPHEIKELTIWLREYTYHRPELYSCLAIIKNNKKRSAFAFLFLHSLILFSAFYKFIK